MKWKDMFNKDMKILGKSWGKLGKIIEEKT